MYTGYSYIYVCLRYVDIATRNLQCRQIGSVVNTIFLLFTVSLSVVILHELKCISNTCLTCFSGRLYEHDTS